MIYLGIRFIFGCPSGRTCLILQCLILLHGTPFPHIFSYTCLAQSSARFTLSYELRLRPSETNARAVNRGEVSFAHNSDVHDDDDDDDDSHDNGSKTSTYADVLRRSSIRTRSSFEEAYCTADLGHTAGCGVDSHRE